MKVIYGLLGVSVAAVVGAALFVVVNESTPTRAAKVEVGPELRASHFQYSGHDYILFHGNPDNRIGGVVDAPDCKACEAKQKAQR